MRRTLTQTAAILNIVIYSILAIGYGTTAFFGFIFSDWGYQINANIGGAIFSAIGTAIFFITIPLLVISILQIVFSAKILKVISAPKQKFAKSFGIIITSIVYSFLHIVFIIIGFISTEINIISMIELIVLVLIIIFFIVDMAKNKNHDDYPNPLNNTQNQQSPMYSDSSVEIDRNYRPTPTQTSTSEFETQLERLVSLKEQGMINQEEFDKLKQNLIEKELKK